MASTFKKMKKTYSVKGCGLTKTQAKAKVKALRKDYPGAAMNKSQSGKYCVGTRGKKSK